jgi:transcriptional regulator with XRE-family HTH domain
LGVKLGDVLRKERLKKSLSLEETARELGITEAEYTQVEAGETPAERWGPILAAIAIELQTPSTRLLAESGKSEDTKPGQAGSLIAKHRTRRSKTTEDLAKVSQMGHEEYLEIERGASALEKYGPLFLRFSELIDQPMFNLFYPCGVPFQKLDDYP